MIVDRPNPGPTVPPQLDRARPIIEVEGLWKGYRRQRDQISLRHEASRLIRQTARHHGGADRGDEPFWALRDVSFRVEAGEAVALVGRNGSGKTTLFRVLCNITRATRGRATVSGRFATLIALGAGFNPERTGRKNITLNAAIQGVPPRRSTPLIDEIIDFAELAEFIDEPVKHYSSGMVARLGFSIAAHIAPDIVFIDEVLAVGDVAFQEKCVDRILLMKAEGRTLMFVSHSANLVRSLCERAVWLHQGQLRADGPVEQVLRAYEATLHPEAIDA
jgi:lipopolysaccharide transport system ATP-binding protein